MIVIYQSEVDFDFTVENMTMSVAKIKQNILYRIYPKNLHINNNIYKLIEYFHAQRWYKVISA